MDVKKKSGQLDFIRLITNWSLCDYDQLGYDPTITYKRNGIWHVEVPNDINKQKKGAKPTTTYVVDESIIAADKLFGRHTRCWMAYKYGDRKRTRYAIKDYWTIAESEDLDTRDEIKIVGDINEQLLENDSKLQGRYPKYAGGGIMCLDIDGERVKDTTDLISHPELPGDNDDPFSMFSERNFASTFRIHKRIVMTPCGRPLREIESIPELIIVLDDVMKVYMAIAQRTGYLHRDISETNILFVGEGVNIRGVLIDFDNALPKNRKDIPSRPIMSGSPLFESIGCLQELKCQRNELDNWESLLYLVCSLGIYGINGDYRVTDAQKGKLSLAEWCTGNSMDIGEAKRKSLDINAFKSNVSDCFNQKQPYCEYLYYLATNIHRALFFNKEVEEKNRGYKSGTIDHTPVFEPPPFMQKHEIFRRFMHSLDADRKDPLMCRTNDEDVKEICKELMKVMGMFKAEAIKLLGKNKEEKKRTTSNK